MLTEDQSMPLNKTELNARERAIAQLAAEIAVKKITDEFYKEVGKTVIQKFVISVGALTVAALLYARSKGWV